MADQAGDNSSGDGIGGEIVGHDDFIGVQVVSTAPLAEKSQLRQRLSTGKQRPLLAYGDGDGGRSSLARYCLFLRGRRQTLVRRLRGRGETDQPAMAAHQSYVFSLCADAAPGGNDGAMPVHGIVQGGLLPDAKSGLTLFLEDRRDAAPGGLLDQGVGIYPGPAKHGGDSGGGSRLAAAGWTDEIDPLRKGSIHARHCSTCGARVRTENYS